MKRIFRKIRAYAGLIREAAAEWSSDNVSRLSAALAYYTAFSVAPLLIMVTALIGLVFGYEAASARIQQEIGTVIGASGAQALAAIAASASRRLSGTLATIIGIVVFLVGVSGVLYELQTSLNTIWEVEPKPGVGFMYTVKNRIVSLSMILVLAFLLLVSLVVSAALTALGAYVGGFQTAVSFLLHGTDMLFSFGIVVLLFAVIYKFLPNAEVAWKDVWVGSFTTALLFMVGKAALAFYLAKSSVASIYGAAASLVILLAWVYYSAQIFFFGAEFTQVYANRYGSRIAPSKEAEPLGKKIKEQATALAKQEQPGRPGAKASSRSRR